MERKSIGKGLFRECFHSSQVYDYNVGEIVCGNCGFVLEEHMLDRGPEWRAFTLEEKASKSRCGAPTYPISSKSLTTTISVADFETCPRRVRQEMWRLRGLQVRSRWDSSIDRNLAKAIAELDRLSDRINIPKLVKQDAARIYRKALREGLIRGRNIVAIVAAAVYASCRLNGVPRTLCEVADSSLVTKKSLARLYSLLVRRLDLKPSTNNPVSFISKIAEQEDISGQTQGVAIKILRKAGTTNILHGKDPKGLAAAALYVACKLNNEKKTQRELANEAGVTEVTLRKHCSTLNLFLRSFLDV